MKSMLGTATTQTTRSQPPSSLVEGGSPGGAELLSPLTITAAHIGLGRIVHVTYVYGTSDLRCADVLIDRDHDDHGPIEFGSIIDDATDTWEEHDAVCAAALGVWDAYYSSESASTQADHPAYAIGKAHKNAAERTRATREIAARKVGAK